MTVPVSGHAIRRHILQQSKRANVGHIGSALSVADILAALYGGVMRGRPEDPDRDRFVMSKGHAALALYAALHLAGHMTHETLETYSGDGSELGVHPHHGLTGVDFSTGSLGQGLSMAAGAALAARLQGSGRRVFALTSDAECNEGSVWEAAMFAAHHCLDNLVAIVDSNSQQALGYTADVICLEPLEDRWLAFGWDVHSVDGHDSKVMASVIEGLKPGKPHVLIAHTTFGKGVSFMESQIRWHYLPMDDDTYALALREIGG
ncbi:MAG: transketolase [Candidatus Dormibacteraceae bacterium]